MKTVMITGASSGLGLSLAKYYLWQGFYVIACGRQQSKVTAAFADVDTSSVEFLLFDVTKPEQVESAAQRISVPIDILILNAGDCQYIDNIECFNSQLFSDVITTNLTSLGKLIEVFLPKIPSGGQLVFISSIVTTLAFPRSHAYGASKAGVDYLANTLRFDLMSKNINVCLVKPGFIKTPLTDKNDFDMPFLLTSDNAAKRIYKAVSMKKRNFHFPKRFTYLLKFLRFMPDALWHKAVFRSVT